MWAWVNEKARGKKAEENREAFNEKRNSEEKEVEIMKYEWEFEKTPWTDKLKSFNDEIHSKVELSFVYLKMSSKKTKTTLDLSKDKYWFNFDITKWSLEDINKKFVILSIVDVVEKLNLENHEKISASQSLVWISEISPESDETDLHYNEAIDDPDYPILKWLEKNNELKLTEIETKAIWEKLSNTNTIMDAIDSVSDELIWSIRKQEIKSVIEKTLSEMNKEGLPSIFWSFDSLSANEWESNYIVELIWSNYAKISWWDWRLDIDVAINRSLNKIIHNKVIPNRYNELMQKNIRIIRWKDSNMKQKIDALKIISFNVNWVVWSHWKSSSIVNEKIKNEDIQKEDLKEIYKKVINVLMKKNSHNKEKQSENSRNNSKSIKLENAKREAEEKAWLDWNLFDVISQRASNDENYPKNKAA